MCDCKCSQQFAAASATAEKSTAELRRLNEQLEELREQVGRAAAATSFAVRGHRDNRGGA